MLNQTKQANQCYVTINRFTGRSSRIISINKTGVKKSLMEINAGQFHDTELFCRINEELRRMGKHDEILVTNCNQELAEDICKWSSHRDAIAHYCRKNQAVAVTRY